MSGCRFSIALLTLVLFLAPSATADTPTTYAIQGAVLGIAGAPGASAAFRTSGTLAQSTPIGIGSTAELTLHAGFWSRLLLPGVSVAPLS